VNLVEIVLLLVLLTTFFNKELIRAGAELDGRNNNGYTPLAYAFNNNRLDCVERLLDAGAKISNVDKDINIPDWFPLLLARRKRIKQTLAVVFALSRPLIGKDVAKMMIAMAWGNRDLHEL
jgi:ankyrin repeat protein